MVTRIQGIKLIADWAFYVIMSRRMIEKVRQPLGLVRLSSFRPEMIPGQICYVQIKRTILAGTVPGRRSPGTEQGLKVISRLIP